MTEIKCVTCENTYKRRTRIGSFCYADIDCCKHNGYELVFRTKIDKYDEKNERFCDCPLVDKNKEV